MLNTKLAVHSFIAAVIWTIAQTIYGASSDGVFSLDLSDPAVWFALALSFFGMAVAFYNYERFMEKIKSGEITFDDLQSSMSGLMR